jgi:hypothetical protein
MSLRLFQRTNHDAGPELFYFKFYFYTEIHFYQFYERFETFAVPAITKIEASASHRTFFPTGQQLFCQPSGLYVLHTVHCRKVFF